MDHVKDPERFLFELERPPPGTGITATAEQLEDEGRAFVAFASMFGARPPAPVTPDEESAAV